MELITRFADEHDIFVITAGDLYQIGLIGNSELDIGGAKENNILYIHNTLL